MNLCGSPTDERTIAHTELEPAGTDNTVSWLAIRGARVPQDSGTAADKCRISLALAARRGTSCHTFFGSDEQIFGEE